MEDPWKCRFQSEPRGSFLRLGFGVGVSVCQMQHEFLHPFFKPFASAELRGPRSTTRPPKWTSFSCSDGVADSCVSDTDRHHQDHSLHWGGHFSLNAIPGPSIHTPYCKFFKTRKHP